MPKQENTNHNRPDIDAMERFIRDMDIHFFPSYPEYDVACRIALIDCIKYLEKQSTSIVAKFNKLGQNKGVQSSNDIGEALFAIIDDKFAIRDGDGNIDKNVDICEYKKQQKRRHVLSVVAYIAEHGWENFEKAVDEAVNAEQPETDIPRIYNRLDRGFISPEIDNLRSVTERKKTWSGYGQEIKNWTNNVGTDIKNREFGNATLRALGTIAIIIAGSVGEEKRNMIQGQIEWKPQAQEPVTLDA